MCALEKGLLIDLIDHIGIQNVLIGRFKHFHPNSKIDTSGLKLLDDVKLIDVMGKTIMSLADKNDTFAQQIRNDLVECCTFIGYDRRG